MNVELVAGWETTQKMRPQISKQEASLIYQVLLDHHQKLEHTDRYTQLIDLEDDAYNVAHATTLEEENKLIEAGLEYVRYSEKHDVAIYGKPK